MKKSITRCLTIFFILNSICFVITCPGGTHTRTQDAHTISLMRELADLGQKFDRLFTVEKAIDVIGTVQSIEMEHYRLAGPLENKDMKHDLDELCRLFPHFSYKIDEANPKIIHIIDRRLENLEGYALERTIKSIRFSGPAYALPAEIAKQGIPVALPESYDSGFFVIDTVTKVEMDAKNIKVRDALTDYLLLNDGRVRRFIWTAETILAKGEITHVKYDPGEKTK